MRIEPSDVGWVVHYEPNEIQLARGPWPHSGLLGFINRRGTISVSYPAIAGLPRDWGARARDKLEDVRAELWESGALRNPREEARARAESRTGDFIVRLSDGRERRFHSFRTDQPYLRGARARPGAFDWADTELNVGRVSYAEVFRGAPPPIYMQPQVLPARAGFGPLVVGRHAHFPIHTWTKTSSRMPTDVRRAYDLKQEAMNLVDNTAVRGVFSLGREPSPYDIAGTWAVAQDAFEEAGVPFQADYARANADYWWRRAGVSSRRPAAARKKRRR